MTKYLVYLKNTQAAIIIIADEFDWNDKEVIFRNFKNDNMTCAVFRMSEIAGWCEMNGGGDTE